MEESTEKMFCIICGGKKFDDEEYQLSQTALNKLDSMDEDDMWRIDILTNLYKDGFRKGSKEVIEHYESIGEKNE